MNHSTIIIIVAVVVAILLLLLYLLRGRKQHVRFGDAAPPARIEAPAITLDPVVRPLQPEGHGVDAEVAAALENVVDQFIGLDMHPSTPEPVPAGDRLTLLKGLGPRAATRLGELGVTRFDQIAAWDETDIAAIDGQMGTFKGRIVRDRWVEQARLLARDDRDAFEAQFGKLGD